MHQGVEVAQKTLLLHLDQTTLITSHIYTNLEMEITYRIAVHNIGPATGQQMEQHISQPDIIHNVVRSKNVVHLDIVKVDIHCN